MADREATYLRMIEQYTSVSAKATKRVQSHKNLGCIYANDCKANQTYRRTEMEHTAIGNDHASPVKKESRLQWSLNDLLKIQEMVGTTSKKAFRDQENT
jgi:hypothetical protein